MKSFKLIIVSFLIVISACTSQREVKIKITNNSQYQRNDEVVSFNADELPSFDITKLAAFDNGTELESQLVDRNEDGKFDIFLFLVNAAPKSTKEIVLTETQTKTEFKKRAHAEISEKRNYKLVDGVYTGGNFEAVKVSKTPPGHTDHNFFYKFEGPGWESEIVGYRFYLDWRNSTDIFGKKIQKIVLPEVGHTKDKQNHDTYHSMADWGMDVFKVGNSLGIGTIAAYENGNVFKVSKTDSVICKITDDGPISASITTDYYGWKVENKTSELESKIFINAGSRLTKQILKVDGDKMIMATGLAKHENTEFLSSEDNNKKWNYIALWGKQSLADDDLGIALFYSNENHVMLTEDDLNYLVVLGNETNVFKYYYSAVWSSEPDGIKDLNGFKNYCDEEVGKLNSPLIIDSVK